MDDPDTVSPIRFVERPISIDTLRAVAAQGFGDLVKAVVDVERQIMAIGGELHADEEAFLLDRGSIGTNLWGINLYPDAYGVSDFLEFDSMINLRPSRNNRSRSVEDPAIQRTILMIVEQLVVADA